MVGEEWMETGWGGVHVDGVGRGRSIWGQVGGGSSPLSRRILSLKSGQF